jgi:hypothetical protein
VANQEFPEGTERWMQGTWTYASTLKVAVIRGYTFNSAHATLADITSAGGTVVTKSAALTSKTYNSGTFDAADTSVSIASGGTDGILVLFADPSGTDTNSTNYLVLNIDTGPGLPIPGATTGSVPIQWNSAGVVTVG